MVADLRMCFFLCYVASVVWFEVQLGVSQPQGSKSIVLMTKMGVMNTWPAVRRLMVTSISPPITAPERGKTRRRIT